jgi:predicted lipoprotein with Yx(FWY)xxD motif
MRTSLGLPVSLIPVLVVWLCLALAAAAPRAAEDIAVPAEVLTMALGHGVRLTDDRGFTLYQYENDLTAPGTSTCVDECAVTRLPLLVAEPSQAIPGNWSMIEREPEVRQWAYRDMPLYRYARDRHPGVAYGEGDGWSVAFQPLTMPAEITIAGTVLGQVLADAKAAPCTLALEARSPSIAAVHVRHPGSHWRRPGALGIAVTSPLRPTTAGSSNGPIAISRCIAMPAMQAAAISVDRIAMGSGVP